VQHFNTQQLALAMTKVRFYYNSNKNIAYIHFSAHTLLMNISFCFRTWYKTYKKGWHITCSKQPSF